MSGHDGRITVLNWTDGQLGIHLKEMPGEEPAAPTIV
jgi:hypothetical protein